jgi:hypothetical protein
MESTNKTIQGDLKQGTTCTPNNQCTNNQKGTKQQQNNNKKQKTQTAAPILKKPTTQADPSSRIIRTRGQKQNWAGKLLKLAADALKTSRGTKTLANTEPTNTRARNKFRNPNIIHRKGKEGF